MGTNYYLFLEKEKLKLNIEHLRKSSYGWKFSWHGFFDDIQTQLNFLKSLQELKYFFVKNEYGEKFSIEEFLKIVETHNSDPINIQGNEFYKYKFS